MLQLVKVSILGGVFRFPFSRFLFSRIIRTSAYQSDISCLVSLKTSKLVQAQKNKADKTGRLV
jgi:hypothetical protein